MKTLFKDLNWKFSVLTALMIVGVMLTEQMFLMKQTRVGMETRLAEKAAFVNTFYAFLIADSLQRKDDVTLLQVINRLEEDPEITSVVVVDGNSEVRYHADSDKLGTVWDDALIKKALETGEGVMNPFNNTGGRALALVSPLKVQGQPKPIGAVRIEFTYKHVQDQIAKFGSSFNLAILGFISAGVGFMMIFVRRWVTIPLEALEKTVNGLHLATAEGNLPESENEFGRINKALNDMIARFRQEIQEQMGLGSANPEEIEKGLIEQLISSFIPSTRIIIVNKENKIISDTLDHQTVPDSPPHLLDLITDVNFSTLVGSAYQNENTPVWGQVRIKEEDFIAAIVCLSNSQSKIVKAVIILQPPSKKGETTT